MRGRGLAGEQSRLGQDEGSVADRHGELGALRAALEPGQQAGRRFALGGHDDDLGLRRAGEGVVRNYGEPPGHLQRSPRLRHREELEGRALLPGKVDVLEHAPRAGEVDDLGILGRDEGDGYPTARRG